VHTLRDANVDNISLDFIYGIPGQSPTDLEADIEHALLLRPEHLSWYELEAKPGTRFTHAHGEELARQAEAMEDYYERVVEAMTGAGYRWYETANFCLEPHLPAAGGRDLRARHNLAYWRGRDYLGIGVGAVSTVAGVRRTNRPGLAAYLDALREGRRPPSGTEAIDPQTSTRERLLLGLRLDEPLRMATVESAVDRAATERLVAGGLVELLEDDGEAGARVTLTRRGRFLAGGVTAELMAFTPA
jgi:oxygen-independent coproporphyrinogen-3 oxidase